ncbi:predicted protein [Chaetomium globosum CBS 148.51]|uniref:Uncharacterized protein n=1 Tax=Chaetomium globosum (strain ATCC 6205 / CBS 148.51 / DSM 1962 / NBRC 6347 / NRRL 1970) TaxID=306901 RepID=Q2GX06_CHAGB|nr:uncharacterized protein CHGG_07498 [Chaetomium globosum CBS 148.51]EAQ86245.1 predicted protein [Chaetomium globosum CBS 148.51]
MQVAPCTTIRLKRGGSDVVYNWNERGGMNHWNQRYAQMASFSYQYGTYAMRAYVRNPSLSEGQRSRRC